MRTCPVCGGGTSRIELRLGDYDIYQCPTCTFRFAPDAFDAHVDYDDVYAAEEYRREQIAVLRECKDFGEFALHGSYRPFFDRVQPSGKCRLLDVGCGVGRFALAAAGRGWEVVGIDVSEDALSVGREFADFPLRRETLEEVVEKGEWFEAVTAFEVLEHLSDPVSFLRLLSKVGRQVFCTVPNWAWQELHTTTKRDWIPPIHLGFFTEASLSKAAEAAGLVEIAIGVIGSDTSTGLKRVSRRIRGKPDHPMGLWLHAKSPRHL
ncbi:MAG TPA: methyltransferase domain-containing protein [Fimbriimonadaceae bacterium]|nr:methyltransferase domain-containing protein [Fimbriimonadaceae bacterium]